MEMWFKEASGSAPPLGPNIFCSLLLLLLLLACLLASERGEVWGVGRSCRYVIWTRREGGLPGWARRCTYMHGCGWGPHHPPIQDKTGGLPDVEDLRDSDTWIRPGASAYSLTWWYIYMRKPKLGIAHKSFVIFELELTRKRTFSSIYCNEDVIFLKRHRQRVLNHINLLIFFLFSFWLLTLEISFFSL